jgi:hypothetical protein
MTPAPGSAWDDRFATRSPAFGHCLPVARRWLGRPCFPGPTELADALASAGPAVNAAGCPLVPGVPPASGGALAYERAVHADGMLGLRADDWHDLMNLLVWCTFPASKARLNAGHVEAALQHAAEDGRMAGRSPRRDALTLFDENGVLVASADPSLVELLIGFRWRALFVDRRADVERSMRFLVFGHGLLDKLRAPFVGLTGHALVLDVAPSAVELPPPLLAAELDARLAASIDALGSPRALAPLPLLGIPGWWTANEDPAFYDDARYFRPGRRAA